uniref:RNA polymerase sigma factor n=1 Tax=Prevotella sp. GTC17260 TaxID=3236796 RepID=A0AB33JI37_9BACT
MTREQFIALIQKEQEELRGFLLALCCGNKDNADDIAQDSLVKASLSSACYQEKGKFKPWLFKIAHNTFLNHVINSKTFEELDKAEGMVGTSSADVSFQHQDLYIALGTLPPKERSAIVMFYMYGYSIKEIAAITETTKDAVKKQLSRGRDKLKAKLKV